MKKAILAAVFAVMGCGGANDAQPGVDVEGNTGQGLSFEEFKATQAIFQEGTDGLYVASGDELMNETELRELFDASKQGQLIVNRVGTRDDRWSASQVVNLTYCVSNALGANKQKVVNAMASATGAWSSAARVRYVYASAQDGNCNTSNSSVVFNVRSGNLGGGGVLARAFFPSTGRTGREVIITASGLSNSNLVGILRHELGHTLGFRHEHTRPEARSCFEDNNFRALTAYDSASVMHYPQCNGTGSFNSLALTARDRQGVAALYGAP